MFHPRIRIKFSHGLWIARHTVYPITAVHQKRDEAIADCLLKAEGAIPLPSYAELRYELFWYDLAAGEWVCSHRQFTKVEFRHPDRDEAIRGLVSRARSSGILSTG